MDKPQVTEGIQPRGGRITCNPHYNKEPASCRVDERSHTVKELYHQQGGDAID